MDVEEREERQQCGEGGIAHRRILAQMLSLEPELQLLRPILGDARTDALIARERREIFSVYPELRICAWLGATLLAVAAGIVLSNNLERLGPLALAILIGLAAAACYAWTWFRRARATVVDDYVLLLGALLVSADVAFIEAQFHLFDTAWKRHLLILALVHGVAAYIFRSRMVLSLSIMALAGYIGFEKDLSAKHLAVPAFITAALLVAWREIDRRWRGNAFSRSFEHFAANIALFGALMLLGTNKLLACAVTLAIAAAVTWWGFRATHEPFALYAVVYALIAVDVFILDAIHDVKSVLLVIVLSLVAAIVLLLTLHARFKEVRR
jgi:hypothetical protein